MAKKYTLTDQHFDKFVEYCSEFQIKLGLLHYDLTYRFEDSLEDDAQAQFWTPADPSQFLGTIALSRESSTEPVDDNLRAAAFHEMCHVLFWSMYMYSQDDDLSKGNRRFLLLREQHRIINVLGRLLT